MRWTAFFLFGYVCAAAVFGNSDPNAAEQSFGHATVLRVLNIDEQATLYCDLEDLPPIIGRNIPVKLKDLQPCDSAEANRNIRAFLTTLLSNSADTPEVKLVNIQRGRTFCLRADIQVNGRDVAQLLIDRGLAHRILQVKEPQTTPPQPMSEQPGATDNPTAPAAAQSGYVASKSSKVFHRIDCYHARRMDLSKTVYFKTRQEAIETGRRPCKTCSP